MQRPNQPNNRLPSAFSSARCPIVINDDDGHVTRPAPTPSTSTTPRTAPRPPPPAPRAAVQPLPSSQRREPAAVLPPALSASDEPASHDGKLFKAGRHPVFNSPDNYEDEDAYCAMVIQATEAFQDDPPTFQALATAELERLRAEALRRMAARRQPRARAENSRDDDAGVAARTRRPPTRLVACSEEDMALMNRRVLALDLDEDQGPPPPLRPLQPRGGEVRGGGGGGNADRAISVTALNHYFAAVKASELLGEGPHNATDMEQTCMRLQQEISIERSLKKEITEKIFTNIATIFEFAGATLDTFAAAHERMLRTNSQYLDTVSDIESGVSHVTALMIQDIQSRVPPSASMLDLVAISGMRRAGVGATGDGAASSVSRSPVSPARPSIDRALRKVRQFLTANHITGLTPEKLNHITEGFNGALSDFSDQTIDSYTGANLVLMLLDLCTTLRKGSDARTRALIEERNAEMRIWYEALQTEKQNARRENEEVVIKLVRYLVFGLYNVNTFVLPVPTPLLCHVFHGMGFFIRFVTTVNGLCQDPAVLTRKILKRMCVVAKMVYNITLHYNLHDSSTFQLSEGFHPPVEPTVHVFMDHVRNMRDMPTMRELIKWFDDSFKCSITQDHIQFPLSIPNDPDPAAENTHRTLIEAKSLRTLFTGNSYVTWEGRSAVNPCTQRRFRMNHVKKLSPALTILSEGAMMISKTQRIAGAYPSEFDQCAVFGSETYEQVRLARERASLPPLPFLL